MMENAYHAAALMSLISFVGALAFEAVNRGARAAGASAAGAARLFDASCLVLAASAMLGDACLHLIPETFAGTSEAEADRLGLILIVGAAAVLTFEEVCGFFDAGVESFGIANLLVEGLHNFADGLALGVAWALTPEAGLATTVAVAVHELPQELGDFAVLRRAGFSTGPLLLANFAASLSCFGGVALANAPLVASRERELVAFTAGSFLALSLSSLVPQAVGHLADKKGAARAFASCWGLALLAGTCKFLLFVGELEEAAEAGKGEL
mmetsp:Transcript_24888/g.74660  ORF Transcript_24888/g.74660 Transcript_24888/m.74660 type:complete len:268 (-) Transcript_24888:27-830(-)